MRETTTIIQKSADRVPACAAKDHPELPYLFALLGICMLVISAWCIFARWFLRTGMGVNGRCDDI